MKAVRVRRSKGNACGLEPIERLRLGSDPEMDPKQPLQNPTKYKIEATTMVLKPAILVITWIATRSSAFIPPAFGKATIGKGFRLSSRGQETDDAFDPLLSPHSYPNGIDAGAVTPSKEPSNTESPPVRPRSFGFVTQREDASDHDEKIPTPTTESVEFDPLLSPHAYPNGIDSGPVSQFPDTTRSPRSSNTLRKPFGIALPTEEEETKRKQQSSSSIDPETFDPTISPHAYGTSSSSSQSLDGEDYSATKPRGSVVGVLLIDHGSKSPAANERLNAVADRYRATHGGIVTIAHMELAEPSIRDGIQVLLDANVDEILCQPYFLSPGRHVREDIPRLVQEAIDDLRLSIPCRITPHVGSVTDGMVEAIHSLVTQEIEIN